MFFALTIRLKIDHTELMKILKKTIFLLIISLAFGACATAKAKPKPFTVDFDGTKIELGEIEAQFDRFISLTGLKKLKVAVSYYPDDDAVCLQYRSELVTYYQFWSKEGRDAFISSLVRYNEDYDARNLVRNGNRTLKNYGTVQGYLVWQLHRFAVRARGNMAVDFGYFFKDKSPYFTVNQKEAEYIATEGGRDNDRTSQVITIYFTRAQAEELTVLFDRDYLDGIAGPRTGRIFTSVPELEISTDEFKDDEFIKTDELENKDELEDADIYEEPRILR